MGIRTDPKERLIWKLSNCLRGDAMLMKDANDKTVSPEEKLKNLEVIGEFLEYIKDYDKNKRIIQEYKDLIEKQIDDRR